MKLYYFKASSGNVGDDLNVWLWPRIFADLLDDNDDHLLIGIGTILNHRIPESAKYTVITSGYGYGELPIYKNSDWEFIGVRGPLTQEKMKIGEDVCLLDGAYLMPRFLKVNKEKKYECAYIPHVDSMINGAWENVASLSGIRIIDPRWSVEKFITELCLCERVLTEAMHGAILADAYGIPWQAVKAYEYINDFKWQDWSLSLDMSVDFANITPVWKGDIGQPVKRKVINTIKRTVNKIGFYPGSWSPVNPVGSSIKSMNKTASELQALAANDNYVLSDRVLMETKSTELLEAIESYVSAVK